MNGPEAEIPDDLHTLAGEYVLGVLERADRRAVQQLAAADPRLDDAITYWERRLAPMADIAPRVSSPPALWARIEQGIAGLSGAQPAAAASAAQGRANVVRLEPRQAARAVRRWQGATLASLALAAGIAAFFLTSPPRAPSPMPAADESRIVAVLSAAPSRTEVAQDSGPQMAAATGLVIQPSEPRSDGPEAVAAMARGAGFLASVRPDGSLLMTAFAPVKVPSGKALQLWIQRPDADAPTSLGLLPAAGGQITMPAPPALGTTLIVTLEPVGASVSAPSGPVVFAGRLQKMRL